jgi:hypothetical protein
MSTTVDQYREAKNNYLKLKNQAKKELIARFNELAGELLQIQRELHEDFGEKIAISSKSKKAKNPKAAQAKVNPATEAPAAPSPKLVALKRQLESQKTKLAAAQAAGKPTKIIDDRIYELEDTIRLEQEK